MRAGGVPGAILTAGHRARRLWWRLRKPRTYGVKVLLLHPADHGRFLAVRHSYTDHQWWALPGGRYRPARESAEHAARREVREELEVEIVGELEVLTVAESTAEGKRDTLTILAGGAGSASVTTSIELRDARWTRRDLSDLPPGDPTSRWLRAALAVHRG